MKDWSKMSLLEMIEERNKVATDLHELERLLVGELMNFDGGVKEALIQGLVRPNFRAPAQFYAYLRKERELRRQK